VIAAAVVLAVALAVVVESISLSLSSARRIWRQSAAYNLAADKLNRACAGQFSTMPAEGRDALNGASYHWRLQQQWGRSDGLEHMACTVSWQGRGRQRSVTVQRRRLRPAKGNEGL